MTENMRRKILKCKIIKTNFIITCLNIDDNYNVFFVYNKYIYITDIKLIIY